MNKLYHGRIGRRSGEFLRSEIFKVLESNSDEESGLVCQALSRLIARSISRGIARVDPSNAYETKNTSR